MEERFKYKLPMRLEVGGQTIATYLGTQSSYDLARAEIARAQERGDVGSVGAESLRNQLENAHDRIYNENNQRGDLRLVDEDRRLDEALERMLDDAEASL